jgi:hypothetical protein
VNAQTRSSRPSHETESARHITIENSHDDSEWNQAEEAAEKAERDDRIKDLKR